MALDIRLLDGIALEPIPLPRKPLGVIALDDGAIGMLNAIALDDGATGRLDATALDDGTTGELVDPRTVPLVKTVGLKDTLLLTTTSQSPYPG